MESFSSSKFMFSPAGVLKIVSAALLIICSVIFLTVDECSDAPSWYETLLPVTTVTCGILTLIMYVCFASGLVKRALNTWTVSDMIFSAILFILSLTTSIMTLASCSGDRGSLEFVPEILGIVGAMALAVSTAIIFFKWREERDEIQEREIIASAPAALDPKNYRKSVMV